MALATVAVAWSACRLSPARARAAAWFATTCLFLFAAFWNPLHGGPPAGPWAEWGTGLRAGMVYYPLMVVIGLIVAEPFRDRLKERDAKPAVGSTP